ETAAITRRISLASDVDLLPLLGRNDDHLKTLESELDIRIVARGHDIMLKGDERQVKKAERALVQLAELVRAGTPLRAGEGRAAVSTPRSVSACCRGISPRRSIRICARSTMRSTTCSRPSGSPTSWRRARSRSRPSPTCAAEP